MNTNKWLWPVVTLGLVLQALPAASAEIEEVTVSARKREESILKVPVVATALSEAQLNQFATADLYAVSERVPGLLFGTGTGSFGAQVSLRGVGTATLNATIDQSVSLNIDGMQLTQGMAYKAGMFDMAQVEVLRGPQALFYGKSSPGGVIAIHTADPTAQFEIKASSGYEFEAEKKRAELVLSGPATDALGLRIAASYLDSDGFFENQAVGNPAFGGRDPKYRNFAPLEESVIRGTALWQPGERFTAKLKLNYVNSDLQGDGGGLQYVSCPEGTASFAGIPFLAGEDCRLDEKVRIVDLDPAAFPRIRNGGTPFSDTTQQFGTLELNYELSDAWSLASVTGYAEVEQSVMINGTVTTSAGSAVVADTDFLRRDLTQEVRLASDFSDSPLNFTVGGFYQNGYMRNNNNLLGNTRLGLPSQLNLGYHEIDVNAVSGFGQATWDVTRQLELAAGARWTKEERDHRQVSTITGTAVRTPLVNDHLESDNISPEVTLTFTPTDDLTLFASFKQAFKSGSFDSVTIKAAGSDLSFGDEEVRGYEGGIKSRLLDRTLSLNVAGYAYHYRDLQVGTNETLNGQIAIRTLNAATANIYGVDMDATYLVPALQGLSLNAALNYNHARYGAFDTAPCAGGQTIAAGCDRTIVSGTGLVPAQDLSGRELVRAPEWSANLGFDYEIPVGAMTLTIGASTLYSDKYFTNLLLRSDMVQDAFFKTSASVALRGDRDSWEVALIGNNLGNELVSGNCVNANFANGVVLGGQITGGATSGAAGVDELGCNVEPGREIWVRLTVKPLAFRK